MSDIGRSDGTKKDFYKSGRTYKASTEAATTIMEVLITGPVASYLSKGVGVFVEIRENLLRKKITNFLQELNKYKPEEIEQFKKQRMQDPENFELVSEITLDILEKVDTGLMACMVGKAYSRYLSGELHQIAFEADVSVMRSLTLYLVRQLKQVYMAEDVSAFDKQTGFLFASLGLMTPYTPLKVEDQVTTSHHPNDFGRSFYEQYVKDLDIPSPQA